MPDLQENIPGIPHQITPGNLLMLARNEAVPFDTRVEATLRLHQELPFVPDHLRGKYQAEISSIRSELNVGEIPKEASELGIADAFANLTVQFEDLAVRVDKLEAIVLDLVAPKVPEGEVGSPIGEYPKIPSVFSVGTKPTTASGGANFQGAAIQSLTVENGIVTTVV